MISDDILINSCPLNWYFGQDYSGNVLTKCNISSFIHYFSNLNANLVTADGSIDCSNDPTFQEKSTFELIKSETLIALGILEEHGTFILKFFTTFNPNTHHLLFFICKHFKKVNVYKPACSGHGNNEKYLICFDCLDSKVNRRAYIEEIARDCDHISKDCLEILHGSVDIPSTFFIKKIYKLSKYYSNMQINCIERNLELFAIADKTINNRLRENQNEFINHFLNCVKMRRLNPKHKLINEKLNHPRIDCKITSDIFTDWFNNLFRLDGLQFLPIYIERIEHSDYQFLLEKPLVCGKYEAVLHSQIVNPLKLSRLNHSKDIRNKILKYTDESKKCLCCYCKLIHSNELAVKFIKSLYIHTFSDIRHYLSYLQPNFCSISVLAVVDDLFLPNELIKDIFMEIFSNSKINTASGYKNVFTSKIEKTDMIIFLTNFCEKIFLHFEIKQRAVLLQQLAIIIKNLKTGGFALLALGDILTNFTIDIIQILATCFDICLIFKSYFVECIPTLTFLYVHGYHPPPDSFYNKIVEIAKDAENFKDDLMLHHFCNPLMPARINLVDKLVSFNSNNADLVSKYIYLSNNKVCSHI
ncbi:hypothetical protein MXB_3988 [Myxobolus squamalis]|nr:hypothetical protein MXB_3988 [Myxobolus squamalis]